MPTQWNTQVITVAPRLRASSLKLANRHRLLYSRSRKNTARHTAVYTGANRRNAARYSGGIALYRIS